MVKTLHHLGYDITEHMVAYVFRFISSISYLLSIIVLYIIGIKLHIEKLLIWLMVLLFASTPNLHFWAQTIHPDTLQILFIELAILIVILKNNLWTIVVSTTVLGLAFGIKYSSIFLLPFMALLSLWHFGFKNYKKWLLYSIGLFMLFTMIWLISNPYVYSNFDTFIEDFIYESQHIKYGHGKAENTNGIYWFVNVYKELGLYHSVVLSLGLLLFAISFKKILSQYSQQLQSILIILVIYTVTTFLYLYIEVNMRRIRYLFHILPFIYLFSALGYMYFIQQLKQKNYALLIYTAILIVTLTTATHTIRNSTDMSKKGQHNYIKAYNFIKNHYDENQFVVADYYSYVGKYFKKYKSVWGVSERFVQQLKPDILIINKKLSGRWYWKYNHTKFNELKLYENTYDKHKTYYKFAKKLFSKKSNYKVIYELEDIVILHKKN